MNVYLRAFELNDYILTSEWRKDFSLWDLTTGNHYFVSSEREKKWVEDKVLNDVKNLYCAVCLTENDKMIGYVSLNNIDRINRSALLGLIIGDRNHRDVKNSVESMYLMLKYGFEQLGLHKINGTWQENHTAALYISESLGFKREALLRKSLFKDGEFKNIILGSILDDEFKIIKVRLKFD